MVGQTTNTYRIRGTKVTSKYPVQLTPAEHRLVFSLQRYFDPSLIFADCYLPKPEWRERNSTTVAEANLAQIDCLAISQGGIFVFESKDYGGWIYGNNRQKSWTQVLAFGQEKHQFYNPIRQNATHISALRVITAEAPIYSIIVFGRDTTLKVIEEIPENCFVCTQNNLYATLKSLLNLPKLSNSEIQTLSQNISASTINPSTIVRSEHIESITTKNRPN